MGVFPFVKWANNIVLLYEILTRDIQKLCGGCLIKASLCMNFSIDNTPSFLRKGQKTCPNKVTVFIPLLQSSYL